MGGKSSKSKTRPKSKKCQAGLEISELMQKWKTGDLLALRENKDSGYYLAVLVIPPDNCCEPVPPLVIYGIDHPVSKETLKIRVINVKSAMTLMFCHGFTEVVYVGMGLTSEDINFEKLILLRIIMLFSLITMF